MNITYKFAKESSNIINEELNNGDIIFNQEDKSINVKKDDQLIKFSEEKTWVDVVDKSVIGVALTGEFDSNGAKLAWINKNFDPIDLTENDFNNHPSFNFTNETIGTDEMVKIPLAYWWRGTIPSGLFKDKYGILISSKPKEINGQEMKPNYVAFTDTSNNLKDSFYYGKYRARNVSNVPRSTSASAASSLGWGSITLNDAASKCLAKGNGFHLQTAQEWHEICLRAAIEKKTFNILPDDADTRKTKDLCVYRNIMDFCYDSYTDDTTNGIRSEWMDGVRIKQLSSNTSQRIIQTFNNDGSRTWVDALNTGNTANTNGYPTAIASNQYMDNLFMGVPSSLSGTAPADGVNDIIPDMNYVYGYTNYPTCARSHFESGSRGNGAFFVRLYHDPSTGQGSSYGFRFSAIA